MKLKTLLTTMLTTTLLAATVATSYGQTVIASWSFDALLAPTTTAPTASVINADNGILSASSTVYLDGTNGSSVWLSSTSNPELTAFSGSTLNDPRTPQNAGMALSLANNSANGKMVVFKFPTTGYSNIVLSFVTRGTSSGFNNHTWAWSTDNVTYTDFGSNTAINTSTFTLETLDMSAITSVNNQATVYIRLTVSGATTATGNNRIDNFVVTSIVPDTQAPVATFDPADAATGVSSAVTPTITFDEPVFAIGGAAITDPTSLITLNQTDATGTAVPFTAAIDGTSKVITVTPTSSLTPGQLYYLAIAPVQDAAGNATVAQSITFTTAATLSTETDITGFTLAGVDGTIDATNHTVSVVLPYGTAVTALEPTITLSQGATVSPTGAQDFTNPVTYTVTAEDGTTTQPWVVTVTISGITSIYDIQYTTEASGDSPKTGDNVTISGVVTSLKYTSAGAYRGFYMQDADGAWNGIYVYTSNTDYVVAPGDNVTVNGTVAEFNNLTEISPTNSVTVNSSGNAMPNPAEVTTAVASTEPYESVLVTVKNVNCASGSAGSYVVSDGSANLTVFKSLYADLTLTVGSNYDITGIIDYYSTGSMYELYPRSANDITLLTGIGQNSSVTTKAFPNPFSDNFTVNSGKVVSTVSIYNLLGQKLMERSYSATEVTVPAANLTNGIYIVNVRFQDGSAATLRMVKK